LAKPEIVTGRLKLTPLLAGDAATLFDYRADPEVCRYQSWAPGSIDDARSFIDGMQSVAFDTPGTWFQLAARLRESDLLIGDLGVHFPADHPRQVEIGFTVAPRYQRQGFGAEAVEGLLAHLFGPLDKHRVFASVDPRNEASIALLKRVGMRQEAHFRESLWLKGEWVDDLMFGILASEWKSR
jgi:RimJ/RimL family protein N-acetyltransferase